MRKIAVVLALLGTLALSWVQADDEPAAGTPPTPAVADPGRLTDPQLFSLLQGLGVEPTKLSEVSFRVTVKQDAWTVPVQFALSRSEDRIWITAFLGEVKEAELVPAAALRALLSAYEKIAPAHFFLKEGGRKLHVGMAIDNRGVTAAVLRRDLDHLCAAIRATAEIWDAAPWTGAVAEPEGGKAGAPANGKDGGGEAGKTDAAPKRSAR